MKRIFKRFTKSIALFWVFTLLFQVCFPVISFAITNGPSQPETQGFQPAGTSNMVDLFTGDFQYSIPLFDLEGYPVNLSYQANPGMEDEASWVGLGWTLSPGSVDRNLRGLPDDFKGDQVTRKMNVSNNITFGVNGGASLKIIGMKKGLGINAGLFYNNKKGPGLEFGIAPTFSIANLNKDKARTLDAGLDLSYNTQGGFNAGLNLGIATDVKNDFDGDFDLSINSGVNSREGLKDLNFSVSGKKCTDKERLAPKLHGGLTFGYPTYTPAPEFRFKSRSVTVNVDLGGEFAPTFPSSHVGGFFTTQYLADKVLTQGAYGYLHSREGHSESEENLLDYNKEVISAPYSDKMKKLPIAYGTYDLFSAKANGMAGQFKATRGDIGVFRDAASTSGSLGISVGVDLGAGNAAHLGGSVNIPWSKQVGGSWENNNAFKDRAAFTAVDGTTLYEPVGFKNTGEIVPNANEGFYENVGLYDPVYVKLLKQAITTSATDKLISEKNLQFKEEIPITIPSTLRKQARDRRNSLFTYLNGYEAEIFGLDKKINSYTADGMPCGSSVTKISRLGNRKHHISEVSITQPGGARYIFGIPVYNTLQKEVTFNTNSIPVGGEDRPLVSYDNTNENNLNNNAGQNNYYESRETPPYATTYLLTGVVSPDFVDLTGDGISGDDPGEAVKFKYTKHGKYKWRTPHGFNQGRYNPGVRADKAQINNKHDNKASFVYGERELWYMHTIESRNYVARFYTSNRADGIGINDDGSLDISGIRLQKLDSIKIFNKTELAITNNSYPTPIKTVHFRYNTDPLQNLCLGTPNSQITSQKAKLTLNSVYFTYGKNIRGAKNIYQFGYHVGKTPTDLLYAPENLDRWGIYKDWDEQAPGKYPPNTVFPFTYQPDPAHGLATKTLIDHYASAWNLTQIKLPTGSEITIDYESDTYAYVMNKRAGQYIFVKGFSESSGGTPENMLYSDNGTPRNYIHLDLPVSVSSVDEFKKRYLEDVGNLYFNCKVRLLPGTTLNAEDSYEYITGFAEIDKNDITLTTSGSNQVAILKLLTVTGDRSTEMNPIVKSALTTLRSQLPDLAYGPQMPNPSSLNEDNARSLIKGMFPMIQDLGDLIRGFDKERVKNKFAQVADVNETTQTDNDSWVRLANPDFNKCGGGSRVKKVTIDDSWNTMTDGDHESFRYCTYYDYTMQSPLNPTQLVSSGVASYEPILGNEENLFREPLRYNNPNVWLGPKSLMYQLAPVGEPLFPAPVVGYSQVKVTSKPENDPGTNTRTGIGYNICRFYTAKDFPTRTEYTTLHFKKHKPNLVLRLFKFFSRTNLTLSQGFVVEVNDMHGKPKSEESYNEGGVLVTSTEYRYKTDNKGNLDNKVRMINTNGQIQMGTLGVDMDVWEEMNEEDNRTSGLGASFGVDIGFWGIFPAFFPHVIPIIHNDEARLRTSVTTKYIKRFGILDKIIKTKTGSSLYTTDLLYDSETGEPLLSEIQSEYDGSPSYHFKYPAHWKYDGMGQAYKNQDAFFENVEINDITGEVNASGVNTTIEDLLNAGDEVIVYRKPPFNIPKLNTFYVTKNGDETYLIDRFGEPLHNASGNNVNIKVKRTARRNMATSSIGMFESLVNPATSNQLIVDSGTKVIRAASSTFNQKWRIPYAYKRVNCNDNASLDEAKQILCQMALSDNWWYRSPDEGIKLCTVMNNNNFTFNGKPCTNLDFYAVNPEQAYGYTNEYQVRVGDCIISARRADGKKFNPKKISCSNPCVDCDPPTGLAAVVVGTNVTLSWVPPLSGGATSYVVEWREQPSGMWHSVNVTGTSTTLNAPEIMLNKNYEFKVKTVCDNQTSDFSSLYPFSTCRCQAPDALFTTCIDCTNEKLQWSGVTGATNYILEWRQIGGSGIWNQETLPGNTTEKIFTGTENVLYEYRIKTVCGSCETGFSATVPFLVECCGGGGGGGSLKKWDNNSQELKTSSIPGGQAIFDTDCTELIIEIECLGCEVLDCADSDGIIGAEDIFNPFFWGVLGNWRSESSFAFDNKDMRSYATNTLKGDGYYSTFNPYWYWTPGGIFTADPENWQRVSTVTKYDKTGRSVESQNAIYNYDAALFGFKNTLPMAQSSNARYTQIAYEGFEDHAEPTPVCNQDFCHQTHFPYTKGASSVVPDKTVAHSGKFSLVLNGSGTHVNFGIVQETPEDDLFALLTGGQYLFGNGQLGTFRPIGTQDRYYVVSAWVYSDQFNCNTAIRNNPPEVLSINGVNLPGNGKPSGPIIEGWRKIEEVIKLSANMPQTGLKFTNTIGGEIYLDDVRVHPVESNMVSYAYDPYSLRLMATLDDRNYATFYEYDDAGILIRTKRETEKGIITVSEKRTYLRPNNQ